MTGCFTVPTDLHKSPVGSHGLGEDLALTRVDEPTPNGSKKIKDPIRLIDPTVTERCSSETTLDVVPFNKRDLQNSGPNRHKSRSALTVPRGEWPLVV